MPYPIATNMEELTEAIKNYDEDIENKKNKRHLEEMESYDKGAALKQIGFLVEKLCTQGGIV